MNVGDILFVLVGVAVFGGFAVMMCRDFKGYLPLLERRIAVRMNTDHDGKVAVVIRNGLHVTVYAALSPAADDFDVALRNAISEARVVACGMRDADRHARRKLPA